MPSVAIPTHVNRLAELWSRIRPAPEAWLSEAAKELKEGDMGCLPCSDWNTLVNSWRKALKWTEGLDTALSVMLASVISTKSVGEQLWVKILGPPSCLHGDTPIYDPVDNSWRTLQQRWIDGKAFHVLSCTQDGFVIAHAFPPQKKAEADLYEVIMANGTKFKATGGHKVWDGREYLTIEELKATVEKDVYRIYGLNDVENLVVDSKMNVNAIISIEKWGRANYYDFHVPETNNYWAEGLFHHNCGKTTILEGLAVNGRYIISKSTIRGFHSGWKSEDGQDHSLVAQVNGKTLATKDGDALLKSPNLGQILSEARDLYDRVSRTHYRNAQANDYTGVRMTWLLCGTSALREIDESELGARFIDCVVMDEIDDEFEDEVAWRAVNQEHRNMSLESNGVASSHYGPDLARAMQLTGGYVDYLRSNAQEILGRIEISESSLRRCATLGKFIAYMRARPNKKDEDDATREFSARLAKQQVRLAICLAGVLNRKTVDAEVSRRVTKVAIDTSKGQTYQIVRQLAKRPDGRISAALAEDIHSTYPKTRGTLRFLKHIGVVQINKTKNKLGVKQEQNRWVLTERLRRLFESVETGVEL